LKKKRSNSDWVEQNVKGADIRVFNLSSIKTIELDLNEPSEINGLKSSNRLKKTTRKKPAQKIERHHKRLTGSQLNRLALQTTDRSNQLNGNCIDSQRMLLGP
jgi:predicted nucleotidyltransferase